MFQRIIVPYLQSQTAQEKCKLLDPKYKSIMILWNISNYKLMWCINPGNFCLQQHHFENIDLTLEIQYIVC